VTSCTLQLTICAEALGEHVLFAPCFFFCALLSLFIKLFQITRSGNVLVSRRKSRELALQILFLIDFSALSARETYPSFVQEFRNKKKLDDFTKQLVEGVEEHREAIDKLIRQYSEHWSLKRISRVDRNILRLAIFEILWCPDIPPNVSINEAVELAKRFGTEKSAAFINGILDRIAHLKQTSQLPC
jgi:N utilization substance protein B